MKGLHIGRVFLFFSFTHNGIKYPSTLIQWYIPVSDEADEDTGLWVVELEHDANGQRQMDVVHVHSILHGAHLIPVYGWDCLPINIQHTDALDIFNAYYVNKYIDHHALEIAF